MLVFFLVVLTLMPLTMIGIGWLWKNQRSPKKINPVMGYRTPRSIKSQATWEFAHRYFGAIWFAAGLPLLLVSLVVLFLFKDASSDLLGNVVLIITCAQVVGLFLPIIPTEIALRKRFDGNGNPKP